MTKSPYDKDYSKDDYYWGKDPTLLCKETLELIKIHSIKIKNVIDIGTGEGRDAVHFAKQNYDVTATDISKPGLNKAKKLAEENNVHIETFQEDVSELRLEKNYDLIFSAGTLQFVNPEKRDKVFANYKEKTNIDGINAISVFVEKPFLSLPPDWEETEFMYESGDLLKYYKDWEILSFTENIFECNSSGIKHKHCINRIIARKIQ